MVFENEVFIVIIAIRESGIRGSEIVEKVSSKVSSLISGSRHTKYIISSNRVFIKGEFGCRNRA
jgi:hypothetical protein